MKKLFAVIILSISLCSVYAQRLSGTRSFEQNSKLSAVELYNLGVDQMQEKNWWQASEYFSESLQKNPVYADAWFRLSKCSYEMNQFDLSITYADNAIKYAGSKPEYINLKALAFVSQGKLDEARTLFSSILKNYPNNLDARFGLAELELFAGKISAAESYYLEALKRSPSDVKALLSLALVSTELGKYKLARDYINKALTSHAGNEEVYYVAAFLSAMNGNLEDARKKCLMSVQVNGNYDPAYELLCTVLYEQKKYDEVINIADFRINRNRNNIQPWFVKGLALEKLGRKEEAIDIWTKALNIDPNDEITRCAFENLALEITDVEDPRRKTWGAYHVKKAKEFQKKYMSSNVRYEYQTALKLNPASKAARESFADLLYNDGYNENYLDQIKFVKENSVVPVPKDNANPTEIEKLKAIKYTKLTDTIEGFESLMYNSLAKKWDINPFFLEKTRWHLGIYYMEKMEPLYHPDLARITACSLAGMFSGISSTSVRLYPQKVSGYADAFKKAHDTMMDYFVILTCDETDRDVKIEAVMYSTRTGAKVRNFNIYRTGNDRFAGSLLRLRKEILDTLPVRARILNRDGKDLLVDIGKTEGVVKGTEFAVVKKGQVLTNDSGTGLVLTEKNKLGTVTLTKVSEEISEGVLSETGFYDRVNVNDELILVKIPQAKTDDKSQVAGDTSPSADQNGTPVVNETKEKASALKGADLEISRTPNLLRMIRELY
ncbi:MAG: tetratricopeptide repeat protein [Treponema sp.]|nr:tetratricopeptide repeat protein [Treponema sp.]